MKAIKSSENFLSNPVYAKDLVSKRRTCINCWHMRDGHCALYSSNCATDILRSASNPAWWTSYEDGEQQERRVLGGHKVSLGRRVV